MAPRPHRRRSRALLVAPLTVLTLLAAACGSDDASTSNADASSATVVSAATDLPPATDAPAPDTGAPEPTAAPGTAAGTADTPDSEPPAAEPIELLSFSAPLIGGGTFDGTTLGLERPVAFWFWAPT